MQSTITPVSTQKKVIALSLKKMWDSPTGKDPTIS